MSLSQRDKDVQCLTPDGGAPRPLVLLLMQEDRNRSLLAETLTDEYRVETATDAERLPSEFDCCIIDQRALERREDTLRRRVESEGAFLPIVLLVQGGPSPGGTSKYWNIVDDIITIPVNRRVLLERIENLVVRRQGSVALTRQRAELARQNERLDDFASVVAHDLRNPLNIAKGRLSSASEEFASEDLETVSRALDRISSLVEHLLVLAREGDGDVETESLSLEALAEDCWTNVATKDATLVVDSGASIEGDPNQLRQLFENLFRNAIEHGGAAVTIRTGSVEDGFFVEDDGPGVPEEHRGEVFESGFSLGDSGTGLGLAIVRQIADAHGWTVNVRNGAAGGARFEFSDGRSG